MPNEPYCKYGHYEEHGWLPACINEMTGENDPRLDDANIEREGLELRKSRAERILDDELSLF